MGTNPGAGVLPRWRAGDTQGEGHRKMEARLDHKDCQRLPGAGRGTGRTLPHSLQKQPSLLMP